MLIFSGQDVEQASGRKAEISARLSILDLRPFLRELLGKAGELLFSLGKLRRNGRKFLLILCKLQKPKKPSFSLLTAYGLKFFEQEKVCQESSLFCRKTATFVGWIGAAEETHLCATFLTGNIHKKHNSI